MLIMPKKGYRVCLHCGRIMSTKQVIEEVYEGKKVKACYNCGEPEKISTGLDRINKFQAEELFRIATLKSKEFYLNPELEAKYDEMYDNVLIPKDIRV